MIVHDYPQGSEAWHWARLGVVTASQFHRLMTEKTRKPAAGATTYLYELLAALFTGAPTETPDSQGWMLRGTEMEEEARRWYELERDVDVEEVGFISRDDGLVGCSPDGLVGESGGLEIKCPAAKTHIGYLLGEGTHQYHCQIQGSLLVTERAWWDLLVYSPVFPQVLRRFEPDLEWREAFAPILEEFVARLEAARDTLVGMGLEPMDKSRPPETSAPRREITEEEFWEVIEGVGA